jgi:hypothetical protein
LSPNSRSSQWTMQSTVKINVLWYETYQIRFNLMECVTR